MYDLLIVVNMQNDFIHGAYRSYDTDKLVRSAITTAEHWSGPVILLKHIHFYNNYNDTLDGQKGVPMHCIHATPGQWMIDEIAALQIEPEFNCQTNGCLPLADYISLTNRYAEEKFASVTFIGAGLSDFIISNALMLRSYCPNLPIIIDLNSCIDKPENYESAKQIALANDITIKGDT